MTRAVAERDEIALMTFEPGRRHRLELVLGREAEITITGEVDLQAAEPLGRLLSSLDFVDLPLLIDLERVTFLDSAGLSPLFDASRGRRRRGLSPLRLRAMSPAAALLLEGFGLLSGTALDVAAWDTLTGSGARCARPPPRRGGAPRKVKSRVASADPLTFPLCW